MHRDAVRDVLQHERLLRKYVGVLREWELLLGRLHTGAEGEEVDAGSIMGYSLGSVKKSYTID